MRAVVPPPFRTSVVACSRSAVRDSALFGISRCSEFSALRDFALSRISRRSESRAVRNLASITPARTSPALSRSLKLAVAGEVIGMHYRPDRPTARADRALHGVAILAWTP